MERFHYADSMALITGASRGIGAAMARELASRGIKGLILTARTASDLESLADELRQQRPDLLTVLLPADLADPDTPCRLKEETDRRGLTIDLLVNNAGFGSSGPFDTLPLGKESDMIGVNVRALVELTRLYLPGLLARGRGGIVNVGSTAAFQPVPYMATYGATKAFVQSFSEALWAENQDLDNDVRIVCLCPGGTSTNFGAEVGAPRGRFENFPHDTPETVATAGLDALDRGELYRVVGPLNYLMTLMPRISPRAVAARVSAAIFRPEGRRNRGASVSAPIRGVLVGALAATAAATVAALLVWCAKPGVPAD